MTQGLKISDLDFILSCVQEGFPLWVEGRPPPRLDAPNLPGATKFPDVVDDYIAREQQLGRVEGPFDAPPFPDLVVSPIGPVPKAEPGKFRMIHHLSWPEDHTSVNAGICDDMASVQYVRLSDAVRVLEKWGQGTQMAKCDVEEAYRQLPVRPADYPLLGFRWKEQFYFDKRLPMGCRSSCRTFQMFSDILADVTRQIRPTGTILNLLDDYLFIGRPGTSDAFALQSAFELICQTIRLPLKASKSVKPTSCLTFLGLELDSDHMQVRLPEDKRLKFLEKLRKFRVTTAPAIDEWRSLAGSLSYAVVAIPTGRAFLRRLFQAFAGQEKHRRFMRMSHHVRQDLDVWETFLVSFNGKMILGPRTVVTMGADASGSGFGLVFGSQWTYGFWPQQCAPWNIAVKELYPLFLGLHMWGRECSHSSLQFFSDNRAVVDVLTTLSARDGALSDILRGIVGLSMRHNIVLHPVHVPGKENTACDLLSRNQVGQFRQRFREMAQWPTPLPWSASPRTFVKR